MRAWVLCTAAALLIAAAPAKKHAPEAAAAKHAVKIAAMKFEPAQLQVRAGEAITWTNEDLVPHTVTGAGIASPVIPPGGTFTWKAAAPGDHPYACTLHPTMKAQVTVTGN